MAGASAEASAGVSAEAFIGAEAVVAGPSVAEIIRKRLCGRLTGKLADRHHDPVVCLQAQALKSFVRCLLLRALMPLKD